MINVGIHYYFKMNTMNFFIGIPNFRDFIINDNLNTNFHIFHFIKNVIHWFVEIIYYYYYFTILIINNVIIIKN